MLRLGAVIAVVIGSVVAAPDIRDTVETSSSIVNAPGTAQPCWLAPVAAPVIDGYRPPSCRWCAGNRGLEYGSTAGDPVVSPLSGFVAFDGGVAGERYLTVALGSGATRLQVTIGGLEATTPKRAAGSWIRRGDVIGRATGPVHLGVRVGGIYADPTRWTEGAARVPILVPLDGSPGARPPVGATCA
ncbi:MAG: hypothetical protein O3A89_00370 [Actinomycetota bacterium]|nr:hypothetical protein [Actinomycetota bacterium]